MTLEFRGIKHTFQAESDKSSKLASFTFRNLGQNLCFAASELEDIFHNTKKNHLTFKENKTDTYTSYISSNEEKIAKADVFDPYTQKTIAELFDGIDREVMRVEFNKALVAADQDQVYGDCTLPTVQKPEKQHSADVVYLPVAANG